MSRKVGRTNQASLAIMNLALMFAAKGNKHAALEGLDEAIGQSRTDRDNRLLSAVKELRARLERRMSSGLPWTQWAEGAYTHQVIRIRGRFALDRVPPDSAVAGYLGLVQEFSDAGLAMESAIALNELGSVYRRLPQPRYVESEAAVVKALAIFDEIDLTVGKAASWHKRGDLYFAQRKLEMSECAYVESLRLKRVILDDLGEAITLDHLAQVYIAQKRLVQAEDALERSWALLKPFGTPQQKWFPLERLILLKEERNDIPAAVALARLAVEHVARDMRISKKADELLNRLLERQRSM